ncbi:MAG: hypothetical protein DRP16_06080 [Candidatus Aenigmatarchaeota archaeon]|nr:MAG: hypothetical protein DRP16_06080 [Candidatus Aenigmarchaeota archaeon]
MERGKREIGKLLVYLYRKYTFTGSVFEKVTTANMMFQLAKKSWNNAKWKEFEEKMKLCLGSLSIVKSYEIHLNTCSNPDIYEPRYVLPVIEIKNKKGEVERYPIVIGTLDDVRGFLEGKKDEWKDKKFVGVTQGYASLTTQIFTVIDNVVSTVMCDAVSLGFVTEKDLEHGLYEFGEGNVDTVKAYKKGHEI